MLHFMHVYNDLFVEVCYYKGLNFISDGDGELLKIIIEVIYTFDTKTKKGIFRKIFNVIYSTSMHCQMKKKGVSKKQTVNSKLQRRHMF